MDPDEPDYLFNLGQAAARSEKYKEAADAYERFLVVAPKTDIDRRESHHRADRLPSLPRPPGFALRGRVVNIVRVLRLKRLTIVP